MDNNTLIIYICTSDIASLATNATISAQETTPGHLVSSADFAASMTLNPLRFMLGIESFSASLFFVEFSSTEPSHPCMQLYTHKFNKSAQLASDNIFNLKFSYLLEGYE